LLSLLFPKLVLFDPAIPEKSTFITVLPLVPSNLPVGRQAMLLIYFEGIALFSLQKYAFVSGCLKEF
jgi:hypothetical protein